jgi:hypothetical protein
MGIIALITDYGGSDWFAGEMKGAMLRVAPRAAIVDITHDIPAGDIRSAAFSLMTCCRTFPPGAVFCVVVDPGVGTARAALAVKSNRYFFVGPDNGVFSWAVKRENNVSIRRIENPHFLPENISNTFHGRDIFGPIAAHLSEGTEFEKIGPLLPRLVDLPWPALVRDKHSLTGTVIHIDRFGNSITTIDREALQSLEHPARKVLVVKYGTELPLCDYFQQVPSGEGLAFIGSSGFVEIGINNANAAAIFGLHIGDRIEVS